MLPKCAHLAVSLRSMIAPRHPTAQIATMDAEPLAESISGYLQDVLARIRFTPCLVEEVYSVSQVLNIIPLLYHLGDWAEAKVVLARHKLPAIIASLSLNMLHEVHTGSAQDKPLDLARFPKLAGARCSIARMFGDSSASLLRNRPQTFAIAALIEVQGIWQRRGVDVSDSTCPCRPPEELAETMSVAERTNYVEAIGSMWKQYLPKLDALIEGAPEITFTRPIAAALASSMCPSLPDHAISLLRGPLHAHMACA
jgi:hypothetical protein